MKSSYSSPFGRLCLILFTISILSATCLAGSATWNLNPGTGNWNTATNWTPNTIPNAPTDIATFAVSNTTNVSISTDTAVDSIIFSPGASAYTITVPNPPTLTFSGSGVVNNSGVTQNFHTVGGQGYVFTDTADAGSLCVYTDLGSGSIDFEDSATAGSATFVGSGFFGLTTFSDNSSAANGTFVLNGATSLADEGDAVIFNDTSTAADGVFDTFAAKASGVGGQISFLNSSTGGKATITNHGAEANQFNQGSTEFADDSTAANAHITNGGSSITFEPGGFTSFSGINLGGTAGNAVIVNEGGKIASGFGGQTSFYVGDAGNATITSESGVVQGSLGGLTLFAYQGDAVNSILIANGGPDSISAGSIRFENSSVGGTARVILSGTGKLDISNHAGRVTVGSVEGEGAVFLGSKPLGIGSSDLSTELAAVIQDGGFGGGIGGSLTKVGSGTLTLTGANTYTGGTSVSAGALLVANTEGSGTGSGAVVITSGTLGGSGTISAAVTIGTGAFLAPAGGTQTRATLSIQSSLTFAGNATYTYTFKAKKRRAKTDKVVASGVTINSSAIFNLSGQAQGTLTQGLVLTVISNTSATPITGTFSNLPDGAIVNVNGNNFQASYEGGDGNDLTLTVVPLNLSRRLHAIAFGEPARPPFRSVRVDLSGDRVPVPP
jgi:autotransporter-associated beta strand protein